MASTSEAWRHALDRVGAGLVDPAADLALGARCVACGRPGRAACTECLAALAEPARRVPPRQLPAGALPPVYAVAAYSGAVRDLLVAHKERAVLSLAAPLGRALAASVAALWAVEPCAERSERLLVVSPPTHPRRVRERGHDPMRRLVRACCRILQGAGVPAVDQRVLRLDRSVVDQSGLGVRERALNLAGAYRVSRRAGVLLGGQRVVLVDDIVTTGATAAEMARVLIPAGAHVIGLGVVAATPSPHARPAAQVGRPA